jgi:quercetin dioxygenase-like cupin family protein
MKRADRQPAGQVHLYGGTYVKELLTPDEGTLIPQHAHHYDHLSYIAAGSVRVWRDDVLLGDFMAPTAVKIPARAKHRFLTLEPWTLVLCLHAVADAETVNEADLIHDHHELEMEG